MTIMFRNDEIVGRLRECAVQFDDATPTWAPTLYDLLCAAAARIEALERARDSSAWVALANGLRDEAITERNKLRGWREVYERACEALGCGPDERLMEAAERLIAEVRRLRACLANAEAAHDTLVRAHNMAVTTACRQRERADRVERALGEGTARAEAFVDGEREACARVADAIEANPPMTGEDAAREIAIRIRARGGAK